MRVVRIDHMVWGSVLGSRTLFLLPTNASASLERSEMYSSAKLCQRLGTYKVIGINETTKREEVVDTFKKGKFELLALTEVKLKGKGEASWSGVNVIFAGVQELERARKGVAILLNDVWHSAVVNIGCVSSRIFWIKFKFSRVKVCVVVEFDPNKGDCEERDSGTTWTGL